MYTCIAHVWLRFFSECNQMHSLGFQFCRHMTWSTMHLTSHVALGVHHFETSFNENNSVICPCGWLIRATQGSVGASLNEAVPSLCIYWTYCQALSFWVSFVCWFGVAGTLNARCASAICLAAANSFWYAMKPVRVHICLLQVTSWSAIQFLLVHVS